MCFSIKYLCILQMINILPTNVVKGSIFTDNSKTILSYKENSSSCLF